MLLLLLLCADPWALTSHHQSLDLMDETVHFNTPISVLSGPDGSLFIGDALEAGVTLVDAQGRIQAFMGGKGQGPGEYQVINTMAIDPINQRLWVGDPISQKVGCYDLTGKFLFDKALDSTPYALACFNSGELVVGGTGEHNLALFDDKLERIRWLGEPIGAEMHHSLSRQLLRRMAIASDGESRIFVAYFNQGLVSCYDREGNKLWSKERPWTAEAPAPPAKSTVGGMSYDAPQYHFGITYTQGQLYLCTGKLETALLAMNPQDGSWLGHQKVSFRTRSIAPVKNGLIVMDSTEGKVHVLSSKPHALPTALSFHPNFPGKPEAALK